MLVHKRRSGWVYTTAMSWRAILHRFSFALFLTLSVGILVVGHSNPAITQRVRAEFVDGFAPLFDAASRPLSMVDHMTGRIQSYRSLLEENARLRTENAGLVRWQNAALTLENENRELRALLNYKPEPPLSFVTARVIADTGGAFVRSLIITAGKTDGVREGMAAMAGDALVGRVVEVGDWTSRILMITDMNSRIPVTIMGTGEHAVLAGDNATLMKLLYLPQDAVIKTGVRVMTSGHGGIFPPNVPVGIVTGYERGEVHIAPLAPVGRISQVRLIDFNLKAGSFNPMAAKIEAATQAR